MGMSILTKRCYLIFLLFMISITNLYSYSIKEKVDDIEKNINILESMEFDLIDYIPHVDGNAIIYFNSKTYKPEFCIMAFYTSMYKQIYHFAFFNEEIIGYLERTTYLSPYEIDGSETKIEEEFSYRIKDINKNNSKTEKYISIAILLSEELLNN